MTSPMTPSYPIMVAPVRRKSCGVQLPPDSTSVPVALERLDNGSALVRSFICLAMDFRPMWRLPSGEERHQAELPVNSFNS